LFNVFPHILPASFSHVGVEAQSSEFSISPPEKLLPPRPRRKRQKTEVVAKKILLVIPNLLHQQRGSR